MTTNLCLRKVASIRYVFFMCLLKLKNSVPYPRRQANMLHAVAVH